MTHAHAHMHIRTPHMVAADPCAHNGLRGGVIG